MVICGGRSVERLIFALHGLLQAWRLQYSTSMTTMYPAAESRRSLLVAVVNNMDD